MKKFLYLFFLTGWFLSGSACTHTKPSQKAEVPEINTAEMHEWYPPDEEDLQLRRLNQVILDEIAAEISKLYLTYESLLPREASLRASIERLLFKIDRMERDIASKISDEQKRREKLAQVVNDLKIARGEMESKMAKMLDVPEPGVFSSVDFALAVRYFRDGQYKKSIRMFKRILGQVPPEAILDNIYFGIGSSYFKLRKYPQAIKELTTVLDKYPFGDKWVISQVLLGLSYTYNKQLSRALFVLKKALKNHPPDDLAKLIQRWVKIIEKGYPLRS